MKKLLALFVFLAVFLIASHVQASYFLNGSWGSLGASDGQFNQPYAIAVDQLGNTYVSDSHNGRIQKFDPLGNFSLKWGSYGTANGQFGSIADKTTPLSVGAVGSPYGISVDSDGNVYVADSGNLRVQKFDSEGNFLLKWGSSTLNAGNSSGSCTNPSLHMYFMPSGSHAVNVYGVSVDTISNKVYVVDMTDDCIKVFNLSGNWISQIGNFGFSLGEFRNPYGVTVGQNGNIYVTDGYGPENIGRVYRFNPAGDFLGSFGSTGSGNGQFGTTTWFPPFGIAADSGGNIYVADMVNYRVQKFDALGNFIETWSTSGRPHGIVVDSTGSVYVTDIDNNSIQKYSPVNLPGVFTQEATTVSPTSATINAQVASDGGNSIVQSGFSYGITPDLSVVINTSTLGSQSNTATLSQNLSGLSPSTTYYVRAYVTDDLGTTTTGMIRSFTTPAFTYYFNNAVNTDPTELGNYWYDVDLTNPAGELPDFSVDTTFVVSGATFDGNISFIHSATNNGTITGDAIFNDNSVNNGVVQGTLTFNDESSNTTDIVGNPVFYDYSFNGGTITGNPVFYQESSNRALIVGDVTFNDDAYNGEGDINGNVTFNDNAFFDSGSITGNAIFFGDNTYDYGNPISGTKTRHYTSAVAPTGDFTDSWIVVADGAVVDLTNATYDNTTIFTTANNGSFVYPQQSITSFTIPGGTSTIDQDNHTITVMLPTGTDVSQLTPSIEITGQSVSPVSGQQQDFTNSVVYTVTATNGVTTQQYTVTIVLVDTTTLPSSLSGGYARPTIIQPATRTQPIDCLLSYKFSPSTGALCVINSIPSTSSTPYPFTRDLKLGVIGSDVKALQVFLNTHGFPVASTGAGSPGKETAKFGTLTKKALIKFQRAYKITPAIGYFGKVTRGVVSGIK